MKIQAITIEREYGSGGTEIGRLLAAQSGFSFYGAEILEEVSKKYEVPVEKIERYEETATGSFLYSLFMMSKVQSGDADFLTGEGHIFVAEQAVIEQLAAGGPAVFMGHCACEALKNRPGVVRAFIRCSDEKAKRQRIISEYGIPASEAEAVRRRFDKKRSNYYYANTTRKWNDAANYDIMLDSGTLGIDGCVGALAGLLQNT